LPRPLDFFGKTPIFLAGSLLALGEAELIERLTSSPTQTLLYILVWFLIQEVLIQQGKYMWNDIRDYGRDQLIPANQKRIMARQRATISIWLALLVRCLGGLVFASWLSPFLFLLALLIVLLQVIYEYLAKPRAAVTPLLSLSIVAGGSSIRFLGGAFAAGWQLNGIRLWLYAIIFFAIGASYAAALWRTEALYLRKKAIPWQRGQSAFFLVSGIRYIILSMGSAAVLATFLLFDALQGQQPYQVTGSSLTLMVVLVLAHFYTTTDYESFVLVHVNKRHPVWLEAVPTAVIEKQEVGQV
jgi:4-hydroxybenzoate polyprenyltransferase